MPPRAGIVVKLYFHDRKTVVEIPVDVRQGSGRELLRRLKERGIHGRYLPARGEIEIDGEQNVA